MMKCFKTLAAGLALTMVIGSTALSPAQRGQDRQTPNEAEKLFRQMEAKVAKAKTLECEFDNKEEGNDYSSKGKLLLADGNKMRLELTSDDGTAKDLVVVDGVKVFNMHEKKGQPGPKSIRDISKEDRIGELGRASISHSGWIGSFYFAMIKSFGKPGEKQFTNADDYFGIADFKLGNKEMVGQREAQVVQYTMTAKTGDANQVTFEVSVWIDVKTQLPLKRVISFKDKKDVQRTITETYSKLAIDEKIDPKQFELPKE
jgi:outer membrane lipoprotein-sorting protein